MGDVGVTRDLLNIGANPAAPNAGSGETPLIRAVLFTNNYDKQTFPKIVQALAGTITERDWHGATVFHHIAETARSRSKWSCARYYCEVLINKMLEMGSNYVQALLASTDKNHDTAVLCAVRNGCVKVASFLLNHCPEAGDVQNLKGETANEVLRALKAQRDSLEQPPSSPLRPGESYPRKRSRHAVAKQHASRAASQIFTRVSSIVEEESAKLANMYEAEMHEKDAAIADAKASLSHFETQRHRIRGESYALMAKTADDSDARLNALRNQYEQCLRETESLLEQAEHGTLQAAVRAHDTQTPVQAFRSSNPTPLTPLEMAGTLPWAVELLRLQQGRRELVVEIARLMGDAGTGERVGKHRKLVAIATGLREDELDGMSGELLESLQATQGVGREEGEGRPRTPLGGLVGVVGA
jgi:transcription factor MBP1